MFMSEFFKFYVIIEISEREKQGDLFHGYSVR